MKNWSYTIKEGEHAGKTLWSGRYCAVCGIVWTEADDGDILVLANKRGKGTPDYQGYWNLPCGFLESDETGREGVCREISEECGYSFKPGMFNLEFVQTDPMECNNGNVTIFYSARTSNCGSYYAGKRFGGEADEVDRIEWVSIHNLHKFNWAFNHDRIIKTIFKDYLN